MGTPEVFSQFLMPDDSRYPWFSSQYLNFNGITLVTEKVSERNLFHAAVMACVENVGVVYGAVKLVMTLWCVCHFFDYCINSISLRC